LRDLISEHVYSLLQTSYLLLCKFDSRFVAYGFVLVGQKSCILYYFLRYLVSN